MRIFAYSDIRYLSKQVVGIWYADNPAPIF
jgi:hypothetical protein